MPDYTEGGELKLFAPAIYWTTPDDEIDAVAGGCGPGGAGDRLIPDTVYFLSIRAACRIHDFSWSISETVEEKNEGDRVFLNNMIRIVNFKTRCKLLRILRQRRVFSYYQAVFNFGGPAFWKGKNPDENYQIAAA